MFKGVAAAWYIGKGVCGNDRSDFEKRKQMNEEMQIGKQRFARHGHTYVMGILNLTPDSFSDGGCYTDREMALHRTEQMIAEGAELIDIGGESTRPGYTQIAEEEEAERVCPVIEAVVRNFDVPVSLDTYKSGVAKAGIEAGASMINDIWGLKADPDMAPLIAGSGLPCVLMHNHVHSFTERLAKEPERRIGELMEQDFRESLILAQQAGITRDKILLDPGVGFAKDYKQNLWVLKHLSDFERLGYPVLLGSSRKSVIGHALELPVQERLEGTLATTALAVMGGCCMVRVHDIKENVRLIRMLETVRDCDD